MNDNHIHRGASLLKKPNHSLFILNKVRFELEELWEVEEDGEHEDGQDVAAEGALQYGGILLYGNSGYIAHALAKTFRIKKSNLWLLSIQ